MYEVSGRVEGGWRELDDDEIANNEGMEDTGEGARWDGWADELQLRIKDPIEIDTILEKPDDPGWFEDPHGRHKLRYFDGSKWTKNVSDGGGEQFVED